MLKRILLLLSSVMLCIATFFVFAKDKTPTVTLYDAPNSSKVVSSVPLTTRLVPIIHKKGWVKVGVRPSGQVGWVNLKQYQQARAAFYKPNIQTVYINATENNKGKPTVNIIAYRNGKKLSDKEAKAFYDKMLKQQRLQQRAERHYWQHFNRIMQLQQHEMDQLFQNDMFFSNDQPIILMPGPVIEKSTKPVKPAKPGEKSEKSASNKSHRKHYSI